MAAVDISANKFLRAAKQRFEAAELLLHARLHLDAIYIAGYSIECATKAMLIARTPVAKRRELLDSDWFRGARGHNLEALAAQLRRLGCVMPSDVRDSFRRSTWSTSLRYQVGQVPKKDAIAFLRAATNVVEWVERSL